MKLHPKPLHGGSAVEDETVEQLRAELATAKERIANLESELKQKQASVSVLLSEDWPK